MAERRAVAVRGAGRKGGTATKRRDGPGLCRSIGKKGCQATKHPHGPRFCEKTGRRGGQTMKKLIKQAKRARWPAAAAGQVAVRRVQSAVQ
jgi:general stress protein YciG